jgi:HlyD family secretion protein
MAEREFMATTLAGEKRVDEPESVPPSGPAETPSRKRRLALIGGLMVILIGVFVVWRLFFAGPPRPDNVIFLSGRIEGDDSAVAGKTTGRLIEANFREGDQVKAGDVIAVLDDTQIRYREDQARAGVAQAEARLHAARQQIAVLNEQIRQSDVQKSQSEADAQGRVRQAEAELAGAEAELAQQQASYQLALFDRDAYTRLAKNGTVSERQGKQAESAAEAQAAVVAAAKRRVEAARGALTTAQSALKNPDIRSVQIAMLEKQIAQQQAEIASAVADEQKAKAQLEEATANRNDLKITAPFDGTVVTRLAEPGEMLMAGTPVVTLLDLRKVYLRGYIPEGEIGHVKLGQPARIYLDSNPNQPLDAYVLRIDPQATFTPENTYFQKDRVKQVVGVKIALKTGFGYAKPGMPADGQILIAGDTWPAGERRK